jgi:hypothetical protein
MRGEVMCSRDSDLSEVVSYVRQLEAEVARLRKELMAFENALTPSRETKTKHIGEFDTPGCYDCHRVIVAWTTIKEIMAAIRQHAKDNC